MRHLFSQMPLVWILTKQYHLPFHHFDEATLNCTDETTEKEDVTWVRAIGVVCVCRLFFVIEEQEEWKRGARKTELLHSFEEKKESERVKKNREITKGVGWFVEKGFVKPVAPTTLALSNHFYILKVLYKPIEKKPGGKHIQRAEESSIGPASQHQ
uniref:Uncharacterized protein n=1 Tax=Solanum lycopersicum TaxID=4081 RepID=A0A3Q7EDX9_SOLLC